MNHIDQRRWPVIVFSAVVAAAALSFCSLACAASATAPASTTATAAATATTPSAATNTAQGLIILDATPLRAAPHDSAVAQAQLWRGEVVELRGERLGHWQVWDHRRERGGYIRKAAVQRLATTPDQAPDLLALLRFVATQPGAEGLGLGLAAAYIQAAPAAALHGPQGAEALLALGQQAERLADRASVTNIATNTAAMPMSKSAEAALAAQLDVAARYGVQFKSYERDGRVQICYEGDAFRRVMALPATPEQQAAAALSLTRLDCGDHTAHPRERERLDAWRADVLAHVDSTRLAASWSQRIAMRRASVAASLAYARARRADATSAQAAEQAASALGSIAKAELADEDLPTYNDAAMRANASRWAAHPAAAPSAPCANGLRLVAHTADDGQTCVQLLDSLTPKSAPLAQRCSWGLVWMASAALNREANAIALAVQPTETWRELWIWRRTAQGWTVNVLPPAAATPGIGYAEFAGWVPGGQQALIARESRAEDRYRRGFEVLNLDTLTTDRQSPDPTQLGAFKRWQDPEWKRGTMAVR